MLMIILGAGASFDAVSDDNLQSSWRPPTTDGLFGLPFRGILERFTAAQGPAEEILAQSRRATGSGPKAGLLEAELVRLRDLAPTDRTKYRDLAALRLYIQEVMKLCSEDWLIRQAGVTNHSWLVGQLEEWRSVNRGRRTAYVTFNYDTILDQALAGRFGWNPRDSGGLDGYLRDTHFALLKLHGSYDWVQRTNLNARNWNSMIEARHDLIRLAGTYEARDEFRLLGPYSAKVPDRLTANLDDVSGEHDGVKFIWAPAIALPMSDKTTFVCPQDHQDLLDQLVPLTTGVLAIGWRAAEMHFLQRLSGLMPGVPVWIVSPNSAAEAGMRMKHAGIQAEIVPIASTFSGFREAGSLHSFLGSTLSEVPTGAPHVAG
jgi:hypothetical protein